MNNKTGLPDYYIKDVKGWMVTCNPKANTNTILATTPIIFKEDNKTMEEELNKYLEEKSIKIDENGNFEMYAVVDVDDKDHEVKAIICGKNTEVYSKKRAYEDLRENILEKHPIFSTFYMSSWNPLNAQVKKQNTITEDLLVMRDKMFKVLVNKQDVTAVRPNRVDVRKYKVIEAIELTPKIKFKIKSIIEKNIIVLLYNDITKKTKRYILIVLHILLRFLILNS